jgi:5-methylthioadenosine/S-adenosylhomocysteine deaminase
VKTLIRHARVLTLDAADTEYPRADILIDGAVIVAIGPDLPVPEGGPLRIIEAAGKLAMPGLVNGHFHSQANLMAGGVRSLPLELFMLYEVPPLTAAPPDPRLVYLQTLLGAVEMLKRGITAVHDDAFHNPWPTPDAIGALMEAYRDAGIRATVSIDHPNVVEHSKYPFLHDLLPAEVAADVAGARIATTAEMAELYRWFHRTWHNAAGGRLAIAVSNSAPQRVTEAYFGFLSDFSRNHDLPFDTHILETRLQRVLGQQKYGKSLVRHVHDLGFLDERMLVIHAIWVDDDDMDLLAASGCTVAHNPVCNLRLGSGVMPFRKLRDRGIPIALGSDERSADDSTNLWAVAKMAGLVHQITEPDFDRWPQPPEILHAATSGGARGMRRGDIGRLAPGCQADLILLDLKSLAFTPLNDLRRQLVYSEDGGSVTLTMVAGQVVMQDGRLTTVDEAALAAEIRERQPQIDRDLAAIAAGAARLEPYYRAMYQRACAEPVGFTRWAGGA